MSGGTLHYIDDGIDTGPIIATKSFPIGPHDTAFDVFQMTQMSLWQVFLENIENIISDQELSTTQDSLIKLDCPPQYFGRQKLEYRRRVELELSPSELYRRVRGCDFPGHEPAYLEIFDKKIFLTTRSFFKSE